MDNSQLQQFDQITNVVLVLLLFVLVLLIAIRGAVTLYKRFRLRFPRAEKYPPLPVNWETMTMADARAFYKPIAPPVIGLAEKRMDQAIEHGWSGIPEYWQEFLKERHRRMLPTEPYYWWFPLVDEFTHLMIVGKTGSGKSILAYALLVELSNKGKVAILDPHASPDWRMPAFGIGRNYGEIVMAMAALTWEMKHRFVGWAEGKKDFEPLYIIMDETPAIQTEVGEMYKIFMKTMARESRKVNMHLVVLTQSERVESLGISGEGDIREAFTKLLLNQKAKAALAHDKYFDTFFELNQQPFPCVVEHDNTVFPADRSFAMWLSKQPVNQNCIWKIPEGFNKGESAEEQAWYKGSEKPAMTQEVVTHPTVLPVVVTALSESHVRAAAFLATEPELPTRTLARLLFPATDGSGSYYKKAAAIKERVQPIIGQETKSETE